MTKEELAKAMREDYERKGLWAIKTSTFTMKLDFEMLGIILEALEEPKIGHCKDCEWWKDSDGVYRRGVGAESQCPINAGEVYEGNGYCYRFEPRKSEGKNEVLYKIRAEIAHLHDWAFDRDGVLKIIDKYKTKSEVDEMTKE